MPECRQAPSCMFCTPDMCSKARWLDVHATSTRQAAEKVADTCLLKCWQPDSLHVQGVANRDLKLENLLLTIRANWVMPTLKICDFGYSKVRNTACTFHDHASCFSLLHVQHAQRRIRPVL